MIYEPSDDSFLLRKYVLEYSKGKVLDMGCGSGILAEAALTKTKDVLATDINKNAVNLCIKKGINAIESDLFQKVKGKYDLIIFNPPYLPEDKKEPKDSALITSGGKKGYELLDKFLLESKKHLKKSGNILFVCSSLTGDVEKIIKKHKYKFKKLETQKLFFEHLYVYKVFF
ncbi:MAG: methyltransferase [Candidatus Nanoarchaeia archaeon]|nr:methyltransferase [Candidatus Nanoarchaeia archaeon]